MSEPQPENQGEPKSSDAKVSGVLNGLHKNYMIVGNTHIKTWQGLLVLGVAVGIAAGVLLIANRNGKVEPEIKAFPSPTTVVPPAANSDKVTNWLIAYP